MSYDRDEPGIDLDPAQRGNGDYVVIRSGDEGDGTRYRATMRDPTGIGIGRDPREAAMRLAAHLEWVAAKIREHAPPAFQLKLAEDVCDMCDGDDYVECDYCGNTRRRQR